MNEVLETLKYIKSEIKNINDRQLKFDKWLEVKENLEKALEILENN